MKIGLISESPSLTTGFGITSKQIACGLVEGGHEVVCFGIGAIGEKFDRTELTFRVWAVGKQNLITQLADFLRYEKPNAILINFDLMALYRWHNILRHTLHWNGKIFAHFVVDGLPIEKQFTQVLWTLDGAITPTNAVASYLKQLGNNNIMVAPHGVDHTKFKPLPNKIQLKHQLGLSNKFIIGVFGRNNERKQQPRVILALKRLQEQNPFTEFLLYLHCQPIDDPSFGGWNLTDIVDNLGLGESVFFPPHDFENATGVPLVNEGTIDDINTSGEIFPSQLDYIHRMNLCDVIVNPSFCGGFELSIIEAQACGVPVIVANDNSIVKEVAGGAAILLDAVDVGIWRTGAYQYFLSPDDIARAILELARNPDLRQQLIKDGIINSSMYSWALLKSAVQKMIAD